MRIVIQVSSCYLSQDRVAEADGGVICIDVSVLSRPDLLRLRRRRGSLSIAIVVLPNYKDLPGRSW